MSEPDTSGLNGIIRCTTRIIPDYQKCDYAAVSYAWGSPIANDKRYEIKLDDRLVPLPKNIWRFLGQTRDAGRIDWLWIDILSIDQDNPWERSHQVEMISTIFRGSTQVIVWLGPAYDDSDKAMDSLLQKSLEFRNRRRTLETLGLREIQSLFDRPHWGRLWVHQELRSAKQMLLVCGNRCIQWHDYKYARYTLKGMLAPTLSCNMMKLLDTSGGCFGNSLWLLMLRSRHLTCADPRDRVYALLHSAWLGPCWQGPIISDYTITTTALAKIVLRRICLTMRFPKKLYEVLNWCRRLTDCLGIGTKYVYKITESVLEGLCIRGLGTTMYLAYFPQHDTGHGKRSRYLP